MRAALAVALVAAGPAAAQGLRTEILLDAAPAAVEAEAQGRGVLLRFPGGIAPADAAALARAAQAGGSALLAGITLEHDSARLRLSRPAAARLEARAGGTVLVIEPASAGWVAERFAAAERLSALMAAEVAEARRRFEALRADAPPPPERRPFALPGPAEPVAVPPLALAYRRALSVDAGAEPALDGTALEARGFLAGGPGAAMASALLRGAAEPLPGWRLAVAAEGRHLDRPSRQAARGEFSVSRTWSEASATRVTLLGGPGAAGAGLEHAQRLGPVALRLGGAWNAPWWDTAAAFRRDAVRDGAEAALEWAGPAGVSARLGGGWARYGLAGGATAGEGAVLRAALAWAPAVAWPGGVQPRLEYRLDGEYLDRASALIESRRREVHLLQAGLGGTIGPLRAEGAAGWAWDRFGGSGPVASARLSAGGAGPWRVGLEAGVAPSLAASARPVWRGGGFLAWRFGP